MGMNLNSATERHQPGAGLGHAASAVMQDLERQRLRILRCTAQAMASSPGGLRFKAGTRPWLVGLGAALPVSGRGASAALAVSAD
ncbi:hypothetical protein SAMN05216344_11511 [Polaromonas sp. OV174]|nr:hypothetical protein SAMN05216344_11511 [Polaromonas sp. OV174]